ncbi:hypothetical protein GCM10010293_54340 [Streptomyces griseoflavus]|nr:hypothetical protein GCM10010293_54340 [Streptomyces griseoflavus]
MANAYLKTVMLEGAPVSDQVEFYELTIQLRDLVLALGVARVELIRSRNAPAGSEPSECLPVSTALSWSRGHMAGGHAR